MRPLLDDATCLLADVVVVCETYCDVVCCWFTNIIEDDDDITEWNSFSKVLFEDEDPEATGSVVVDDVGDCIPPLFRGLEGCGVVR